MSDETANTTTEESTASNVISIVDLQNILVVFDLASNRGAFRGNELEQIGQLYNKVARFVKSVLPPAPEAATTETGNATTEAPVAQTTTGE